MECKVCDASITSPPMRVREMMYGLREQFDYLRCSSCGCVQIAEIPANIASHYPPNYYSFANVAERDSHDLPRWPKSWARCILNNLKLCRIGLLRKAALRTGRGEEQPAWLNFLEKPVYTWNSVLDVGCGAGRDLLHLRECGFHKLTGADPYINSPVTYAGGVQIFKASPDEIEGPFDLVMLHHVFEHMAEPVAVLTQLRRLVAKSGQVLIRVPVADSLAAAKYGVNWVQLDAPRHFFLHTRASMETAARRAGLKISRVVYDSDGFQFWGSEQYVQDIPLRAPKSYAVSRAESIFSTEDIKKFDAQATELNRKEQGDQACFVLRHA